MSGFIRPEARATLRRFAEVILAIFAGLFGGWLLWLGGYVLFPLGLLVLALAAIWALQALRRARFVRSVAAPGVVEVDEGQVGYLGPVFGGYLSLPELVEVKVIVIHGQRLWRLKQADGQALLIPVRATGAERLFDAFSALPGMDTQALVDAVEDGGSEGLVWKREAHLAAVPRLSPGGAAGPTKPPLT